MLRKVSLAAVVMLAAGAAPAQEAAERSAFTSREMSRIRNQSIGNSYTADQINKQTLAQTSARVRDVAGGSVTSNASAASLLSSGATPAPRQAASFNSFGSGPASKPFSSASRGPTVSPYMNLFRDDLGDGFDNYNTLVRPQVRQQQVNRSLQMQTQAIDRQIRAYTAKPAFNPQGAPNQSPTGHPTGFMYYSHFYPALQPVRGGRR